ncbi:MAG: hypothetical protein AAGA92_04685 [Planctomycetota bacterium]
MLLVDLGGKVGIGAAEDLNLTPSFDLTTTVFESILFDASVPPFGSTEPPADRKSEEPGFFGLNSVSDAAELATLGASALPGLADVSVSLVSNVYFWDGTGSVDFSLAPASTTFEFDPSVAFGTTNANGGMDNHPDFVLEADPGVPADGVYAIRAIVSVDGIAQSSDPLTLVMLSDALILSEDDAEIAEEAIEDGIVATLESGAMKDFAFYEEAVELLEAAPAALPEPSSMFLAIGLGFGVLGRNRKK